MLIGTITDYGILIFLLHIINVNCGKVWKSEYNRKLSDLSEIQYDEHLYNITNCFVDQEKAKNQYFLARFGIILTPQSLLSDCDPAHPAQCILWKTSCTVRKLDESTKLWPQNGINRYVSTKFGKIVFPPFSFPRGFYEILFTTSYNITTNQVAIPPIKKCYIMIKELPPIPVIDTGMVSTTYGFKSPKDLLLSGINSLDPNVSPHRKSTLQFHWSCKQKHNFHNICITDPMSTSETLTVKNLSFSEDLHINLTVKTESGIGATTFQNVKITENEARLQIRDWFNHRWLSWRHFNSFKITKLKNSDRRFQFVRCELNCLPAVVRSDPHQKIILTVQCIQNCPKNISEDQYMWTVFPGETSPRFDFDYVKDTISGRYGKKFVIVENVFKPSQLVYITASLKNVAKGQSTVAVRFASELDVRNCRIIPYRDPNLDKLFTLKCAQKPDPRYYYELFIGEAKEEMVISGFYPEIFHMKFVLLLHEEYHFVVRVSKEIDFIETDVLFLASDMRTAEIEIKHKRTKRHPISHLLTTDDTQTTRKEEIQKFQELVNELIIAKINDDTTKKFIINFENSLKTQFTFPSESVTELIKISKRISSLKKRNTLKDSDPLLGEFVSLFCKMMIETQMKIIMRHSVPHTLQEFSNETATVLARCLEVNTKSDFDIKPALSVVDIPTVELYKAISEDYPNYIDFRVEEVFHLEALKELTKNKLNATAMAAKALAKTIELGVHNATIMGNDSVTVVAKDTGVNLANAKIYLGNFTLIPSKDFNNSNHSFDVLMSTWDKDLMWWNRNHSHIATPILSIQFWHSSCKKRIKHFKAPASIFLPIKGEALSNVKLLEQKIVLPKNYKKMNGRELDNLLKVYRVSLQRETVLHVNFYNLSEFESLDVVLIKFKFPSHSDFEKHKETITLNGNTSLIYPNKEKNNVWVYIGILPSQNQSTNLKNLLRFNMSFTISLCLLWNEEKGIWKTAGAPGKYNTHNVIDCECRHFSVYAGYVQNSQVLLQKVLKEEIELELQSSYVIFITVAVTFGIYCLLLLLVILKRPAELYYLPDNSVEDQYAYLIIVRTSNNSSAGTTSNVMIKLVGSKRSSRPHVLNYPDPKLHLLQKQGEDMFILTTKRYLGNLKHIELWYDCSGPSPSWYCRDILICDMQSHSQWYFKVNKRFDVLNGVTSLVVITGSDMPKQKLLNRFTFCNRFHTWLLWSNENNFSYMARLTVVLSTILMTYMFVLMHYNLPSLELKDCLDFIEKYRFNEYSLYSGIVSSLTSFVIHIGIAWTFRFSNIEFSVFHKEYKTTHKVSGIGWVVLSVLISISVTFLIIFGFWVPRNTSLIWLTCSVIGIVVNIILFENIFIIVQTYFCKFKLTYSFEEKFNVFLQSVEQQRRFLYHKFDTTLLRPFLNHLYKPLQAIQLKQRKIIVKLRRTIYDDLEDLVMYGVYNIILYVVILFNKGSLTIKSNDELEAMLNGLHSRTIKFSKVSTPKQMYEYINKTLIPTMHPINWYANFAMNDPGMMIDATNKFIGVARLRQHRLIADSCNIPKIMHFLNLTCWPEFSLTNEETRHFGYGWGEDKTGLEFDRLNYIWQYHTEGHTLSVVGEIATYSGGGYVAFLGRTLYNSYANLKRIYETSWIDDKSRSLIIEFLTYNANYNVFNAVRLIFEQSATGYVSGLIKVSTVRMLFVENEVEIMTMVVFILFIGWWMMLMLKLIVGIVKHIKTFYKRVWLMIDLLINLMSIICIVTFLIRMKMVQNYLKALEAVKHNEFVSYFSLLYVEEFLTIFAALLICIATARLWRFLRFGLFFKILERTLSMASFPLFSVSLAFFVILLAFGQSGLMIFGCEFVELATLIKILATLIQLTLKPEDYPLTDYAKMDLGYAYFSVYLLLMQIILFIYITVVIMAYTKAQLEFSVLPESYTVGDYLRERLDYIPKLIKHKFSRLRAGTDETQKDNNKQPVIPKADEFRYANCLGVPKSRIQSMRFIVSCVVTMTKQSFAERKVLTDYEAEMALGVCSQFVLQTHEDDDMELFFKGHFEGEKFRVVDEKIITQIAEFVNIILQDKQKKRYKMDPKIEKLMKRIKKGTITLKCCSLLLKLLSYKIDTIEKDFNSLEKEFK